MTTASFMRPRIDCRRRLLPNVVIINQFTLNRKKTNLNHLNRLNHYDDIDKYYNIII